LGKLFIIILINNGIIALVKIFNSIKKIQMYSQEPTHPPHGFNKPIIEEIDRKLRQHISTLKQHIYYSDTDKSGPKESLNYDTESSSVNRKYGGYSGYMKNSSSVQASEAMGRPEQIEGISMKESTNLDQYYQQLYRNKLPDADYEKLLVN
jgi:hypothetical protein